MQLEYHRTAHPVSNGEVAADDQRDTYSSTRSKRSSHCSVNFCEIEFQTRMRTNMKLLHYWKSKASALIIMLTRKRRRVGSRVPDHSQYKHRRTCNKIRRPFNETKQDPRPYCDYYHCSTVGMRQECLKLAVGRVRSK